MSVLDHIGFEVSDLERSVRFYDGVVPFEEWRLLLQLDEECVELGLTDVLD